MQESLTLPDEKVSICYSTPQDHGGYTNSSWLESAEYESEEMPCLLLFENLHEPKIDVIFTISFKIAAEIEIRKHVFASYFADDLYRLCMAYIMFFHCREMRLHCFLTINSPVNTAPKTLQGVCRRKFRVKDITLKRFRHGSVVER